MDWIQALILGIVQGLTEFLPVSSSGHLVLLQNLFGLKEPELLFDVCVHVGTLMAVGAVFQREIRNILVSLLRVMSLKRASGSWRTVYDQNEEIRIVILIIVGSIPTALLGLLFKDAVDTLFGSVGIVGWMLLVTGTVLWLTRKTAASGRSLNETAIRDALIIGLVQGLAIVPGISRSGSTIAVALFLGIDREIAGRFSFLLSIPAILGALVLSFDPALSHTTMQTEVILLGVFVSAMVGYGALKVLLRLVNKGRIYRFAGFRESELLCQIYLNNQFIAFNFPFHVLH